MKLIQTVHCLGQFLSWGDELLFQPYTEQEKLKVCVSTFPQSPISSFFSSFHPLKSTQFRAKTVYPRWYRGRLVGRHTCTVGYLYDPWLSKCSKQINAIEVYEIVVVQYRCQKLLSRRSPGGIPCCSCSVRWFCRLSAFDRSAQNTNC